MDGQTRSAWIGVANAFFLVVFLPLTLIWLVWKRTDWEKKNKWIATAIIAVVFLFIMSAFSSEKQLIKNEAVSSQTQTATPQKQSEAEGQQGISALVVEKQNQEIYRVERVVDGDTIKLADGQVVRLIGIDSPETVAPEKPVQCFGQEASAKAKEMMEGKDVKMVKDVSETDKYDRLLRYAYVGDLFVNDYLVRQGFARADNFPPDERFKDQFKEAQAEAQQNKRGLWVDEICQTPKPQAVDPAPVPALAPVPIPAPASAPATAATPAASPSGTYSCSCKKTCVQMSSCAEAQYQLNSCGCSARDADKDGVACDSDCQ